MDQPDLLQQLNDDQLKAVTHTGGPLMIIAGAGTGKTTVITKRIAWLILEQGIQPREILALTFTEKAASEMEERVDQLLPMGYTDLWISTFHSFCERVLREHAVDIGLPPSFTIFSTTETLLLVRREFDRLNLDYYKPKGNPLRFIPALLSHFSRLKDELVSPKDYLAFASALPTSTQEQQIESARITELAKAYETYQTLLLEQHALDFGDLVFYLVELLRTRPQIRTKFRNAFKEILVDEFQDTNRAQYELVKLLVNDHQAITIVGDDDQSIYRFRGASLENILSFATDFPASTKVVLNKNYRSGSAILNHAYTTIQNNNPHRLEAQQDISKRLTAETGQEGEVIHLHSAAVEGEVNQVIEHLGKLRAERNVSWGDVAILVRSYAVAEPFVAAFERVGIPFSFMNQGGLYMKPLVLDLLAWMTLVDFPHDGPSMYRVLSHARLGIAQNDLATLNLHAKKQAIPLLDALKTASSIDRLSPETLQRVDEFLANLEALQLLARQKPVSEVFVEIVKTSGLLGDVNQQPEGEQQSLYLQLNQLYKRIASFESTNEDQHLHAFLVELQHERDAGEQGGVADDEQGEGQDAISILTIHASKGLEFPYVFLPSLVEQRFPSQARAEAIPLPSGLVPTHLDLGDMHMSEERRLYYVACTRAKSQLILCTADFYGGKRKRKPSRFLLESGLTLSQGATGKTSPALPESSPAEPKHLRHTAPKTLSFTQIAAFNTCPLQYKFAHILHVPVFGRHTFSFGKSLHATLEHFMQRCIDSSIPPLSDLLDLYESNWIDDWYPDPQTKADYKERGRRSLMDYYAAITKNPPKVFLLEQPFTLTIAGVKLKGRIDRIDDAGDTLEIIDYKTGTPKTKLDWEQKRQLILYKLAAEQCLPITKPIGALTYHYLEDNSTVSFTPKQSEIDKLVDQIGDTVTAISTSAFEATPGMHCNFCDFKDICEFSRQ